MQSDQIAHCSEHTHLCTVSCVDEANLCLVTTVSLEFSGADLSFLKRAAKLALQFKYLSKTTSVLFFQVIELTTIRRVASLCLTRHYIATRMKPLKAWSHQKVAQYNLFLYFSKMYGSKSLMTQRHFDKAACILCFLIGLVSTGIGPKQSTEHANQHLVYHHCTVFQSMTRY